MVEWEKVKKLMDCFPGSIINHNGEFIAMVKENEYFILESCKDEREIKCKVLAWFSRGAHKTQHYNSKKKNNEYHQFMLDGINKYLGTTLTLKIWTLFILNSVMMSIDLFVKNLLTVDMI